MVGEEPKFLGNILKKILFDRVKWLIRKFFFNKIRRYASK